MKLTIVFKLDTFGVELALRGIQSALRAHHAQFDGFKLSGQPVDLPEVLSLLELANRKTFNFTASGFEFDLSCVRNFHLDFLKIKGVGTQIDSWEEWASQFIGNENFVMAWVADDNYDHWQNAHDPLRYEASGKRHDHLPKTSNRLPFPLERTIIDISSNPGRRLLRDGYYEVVGAVMWLGEPFWGLVGTNKKSLATGDWIRVSNPVPSVTRVEASAECFTTDTGLEGKLQEKLRTLLFPRGRAPVVEVGK